MSKSIKINTYVSGYEGLQCNLKNGRFIKAWRELETGKYLLHAGYEGMGVDYREEWDTLAELETSMRKVANLRHWVPAQW